MATPKRKSTRKPRVDAAERTSKRRKPSATYRDKPKRTTAEARDLIMSLLGEVDESPENVEVARDLAFEHEIIDMMMLFDVAADLKLSPVDIGNAEWSGTEWGEPSRASPPTVDLKLDGIEYRVVKDDDAAERIAIKSVENDLENEPGIFNQEFIQSHIDMAKLREVVEEIHMEDDYVDELAASQQEDFWRMAGQLGLDEPEADEDGNVREPTTDEIDQVKSAYAKDRASAPMEYLSDIYPADQVTAEAIRLAGIDIPGAAREAVNTDGWQHFLCRYDGNSHTTKHGYVYWREN